MHLYTLRNDGRHHKIFMVLEIFGVPKTFQLEFSVASKNHRKCDLNFSQKNEKPENPVFETFGTRKRWQPEKPGKIPDFRKKGGFTHLFWGLDPHLPVFSGGIDISDSGLKPRGMKFPSN
jgi:hypothetical protein